MATLYGFEAYPDQTFTTRLSFAVFLVDDFTGKQLSGTVKVSVEGLEGEPLRNRSGYYLFCDLPDAEYVVRVTSDYYFDANKTVELADLDSANPVVEITLIPKPCYPFSPGDSLIRGMVRDLSGAPVPGVSVQVSGTGVANVTTEKGEFVLYFDYLEDDTSIADDEERKKFLIGGEDVKLIVSGEPGDKEVSLDSIREGDTTVIKKPIVLG